jgi:hypothetical protein
MALVLALWVEICGGVCGVQRPRTPPYKAMGQPPPAQGLAPSPSMSAQKLRHPRVSKRPAPKLLHQHWCHCVCQRRAQCRRQPASSVKSHLGHCHAGPWRKREDTHVIRPRPHRCKPVANLGRGWIGPDALVQMRRTVGADAGDASVRSDHFGHARTRCVGPLEMP